VKKHKAVKILLIEALARQFEYVPKWNTFAIDSPVPDKTALATACFCEVVTDFGGPDKVTPDLSAISV
jgi:hypothetical protein